ncbi:YihY/virulence factor BrkB family protein, partial [Ileibacterium valens]
AILYELSMDKPLKVKKILPGILFSIFAWILASVIFSFYVENFANYSVIYGAIGGFMVLLLWLYLTSTIFILGSELNDILLQRKEKETAVKPS